MKKLVLYIFLFTTAILFFSSCISSSKKEPAETQTQEPLGEAVANEVYRMIAPQQAKEVIGKKGVILVDVRTEEEYAQAHIPGAILLPVDDLQSKAASFLPDKAATIIVYCRTGVRSTTAAKELTGMGYTNVLNLGGIQSWPYETASGNS